MVAGEFQPELLLDLFGGGQSTQGRTWILRTRESRVAVLGNAVFSGRTTCHIFETWRSATWRLASLIRG